MEVKLSQKTFKALANPTRIAILKQLDKRNFTQSELAEMLGFAIPTIKQHLQDLEKAGLVEILEEGRKWKYIKLTKDGKAILHPEEKKIWILLSTLGVSIIGGIITATKKAVSPVAKLASSPLEKAPAAEAVVETGVRSFAEETVKTTVVDSARVAAAGSPAPAFAQETVNQAIQAPITPIMTQPPLTPDVAAQTLQQIPVLVYVFMAIAFLSALGIVFYLIKRHKRLKWLKSVRGKA